MLFLKMTDESILCFSAKFTEIDWTFVLERGRLQLIELDHFVSQLYFDSTDVDFLFYKHLVLILEFLLLLIHKHIGHFSEIQSLLDLFPIQ